MELSNSFTSDLHFRELDTDELDQVAAGLSGRGLLAAAGAVAGAVIGAPGGPAGVIGGVAGGAAAGTALYDSLTH